MPNYPSLAVAIGIAGCLGAQDGFFYGIVLVIGGYFFYNLYPNGFGF